MVWILESEKTHIRLEPAMICAMKLIFRIRSLPNWQSFIVNVIREKGDCFTQV